MELNQSNFYLYAAKNYYNPLGVDHDEFSEDLKRFKYVKRLVNRYLETGELSDRLILNHLIVIHNVFGIEASVEMMALKLQGDQWPVIKPFLIFLRYITNEELTGIDLDKKVVERLRKI